MPEKIPVRTRRKGTTVSGDRQAEFVPGGLLGSVLVVLLSSWIPAGLLLLGSHAWLLEFLGRAARGGPVTVEEGRSRDLLVGIAALAELFLLLATAPVFIAWYRRAYRNLLWFGADRLSESSAWACWSFVIPWFCWVTPYQVMQESWRGSDPAVDLPAVRAWRSAAGSRTIRWWWGSWCAWNLLAGALIHFVGFVASGIDLYLWKTRLLLASDACLLAGAGLAIAVVRAMDARQAAKAPEVEKAIAAWNEEIRRAKEAPAPPPPPPEPAP